MARSYDAANLIDLLIAALPLIEDAATFDDYDAAGKARYRQLARDVRKAVTPTADQVIGAAAAKQIARETGN